MKTNQHLNDKKKSFLVQPAATTRQRPQLERRSVSQKKRKFICQLNNSFKILQFFPSSSLMPAPDSLTLESLKPVSKFPFIGKKIFFSSFRVPFLEIPLVWNHETKVNESGAESMPESNFFEATNIMIVVEEHSLQLLNEKIHALLNHEPNKLALQDNLTFTSERPEDLLTSNVFSFLLKPASLFKKLEGHKYDVRWVAFSSDSKLIASASVDNTVRLWNIPNGDLNAELRGHTKTVYSVAFSPDGQSIVTGSDDKTVRIWSVSTKQVKILKGHSEIVNSVAWSSNDLIASGSADKTVILWDANSGSMKKKLTVHTSWVYCVSFSPNGNKLASAGHDCTAIIYDAHSGAALIQLTHSSYVSSVCFSHDDQFVVTGCDDGIVRMLNANNGHEEKRFDHANWIWSVACSFDGSMIASGSFDKSVKLWDVASTKQLQRLDGHTEEVNSVAFSHDGKFMASASGDKTVRLWNAPLLIQTPHQPKEQEGEEEEQSRKRQKIDHK